MSFIFTNQASRHGLSVLLLFPCFFYLSFFSFYLFLTLLSFYHLHHFSSLHLHSHFQANPRRLPFSVRVATLLCTATGQGIISCSLFIPNIWNVSSLLIDNLVFGDKLLVTMCARSKSIGAVDYSQFPASSSDSKCRGCEAKVWFWHANSFWRNIIWTTYDHHHHHQVPRMWSQGLFAGPRPNIF